MIERCRPAGSRSVTGRVAAILREVAARPDRSVTIRVTSGSQG
jgi:hypothetical protein